MTFQLVIRSFRLRLFPFILSLFSDLSICINSLLKLGFGCISSAPRKVVHGSQRSHISVVTCGLLECSAIVSPVTNHTVLDSCMLMKAVSRGGLSFWKLWWHFLSTVQVACFRRKILKPLITKAPPPPSETHSRHLYEYSFPHPLLVLFLFSPVPPLS